jgi:single-strand DNA-binding protein
VDERVKNPNGEWVEQPIFVDVTLWERTAEVASEYLSKGSPVLIEGRLKLDTWENKEGQKQSKLRVVCQRMQMLGGRGAGASGSPGPAAETAPRQAPRRDSPYSQPAPAHDESEAPPMEPPPDDIPF